MTHHYNLWLVLLSVAVAWLSSYAMLEVALRVRDVDRRNFRYWLLGGSAALGFGVWSTHFIGMLAHIAPTQVGYDPSLTLLSIVPAIISAALALSLFRRRAGNYRIVITGGVLIGVGIASMHYTGMAALKMSPAIEYDPLLFVLSWVIAIGAATAGLGLGQRMRVREPSLASKLIAAVVLGLAIISMHYTGMAAATFPPHSASRALSGGLDTTALAAGLGIVTLLIIILLIVISEARLILERSLARELQQMALYDQLTGLANRTLFHEQLASTVHRSLRHHEMFAVLAIDLDRFKEINDQFGHGAGDALLRDVAERLKKGVRQEDLVGRLSGDEFIVLTAEISSPDQVALMAQRLLAELDKSSGSSGVAVNASIGIALFPQDGSDGQDLMRQADFALYHAKASGGGCYHFYDGAVEHRVRTQQKRLEELKVAVEQDQLTLVYQPQIDVTSGAMVGVEALVRWRHPTDGLLAPAAFIPLAESARIMPSVDYWVLRHACTEAARWQAQGMHFRIGVNISAQSIDDDLVQVTAAALRDSGLEPGALELEITETSVLTAGENTAFEVLSKLSGLGIQLSIDDFGTGYGSLIYLDSMPVDAIKIDRQFVQAAPEKRQAAAIVESLLALGRSLGVRVVGEGVETPAEQEFLGRHGCEIVQGFFYSQPLSAPELVSFLGCRHGANPQDVPEAPAGQDATSVS